MVGQQIIPAPPPGPVISNFADWLSNMSLNASFDESVMSSMPTFKDVVLPGVMTPQDANTVLTKFAQLTIAAPTPAGGGGATAPGATPAPAAPATQPTADELRDAVVGAIQLMVTFSTSGALLTDSGRDQYRTVTIPTNATTIYSYGNLRTATTEITDSNKYPNPFRSLGRALSSLTVQLIMSNHVEANMRVCNAHAIPPNFRAFSPDFIIVNTVRWGHDAAVAAMFGRMVALATRREDKETSQVTTMLAGKALPSVLHAQPDPFK